VAETAKEMGITTHLDGYPAEGLGGLRLGVSPLEMADAYATLAAGGIHSDPQAIKRVVFPDGRIDNLGKPKRKRVLPNWVAGVVVKILQQNMQKGTATAANIGCPAFAKTGTTDNFNDAWLDGSTPNMTTAVWVGYPNALIQMRNVHGIEVAGGTIPAQIWHDYMSVAHGSQCNQFGPFDAPQFSSFFGKHSMNGRSHGFGGGRGFSTPFVPPGTTGRYPPSLYASPPQGPPNTSPPSTHHGGGHHNGGGPGAGNTATPPAATPQGGANGGTGGQNPTGQ
jgi:penicillin-binding protein 1A